MTLRHSRFIFAFPHNYEVKLLESYLLHPAEKLYQFPADVEEGDRTGVYLRIAPQNGAPWVGFFALGFDSDKVASGIYSCPDPDSLCVAAGGYAYVVNTRNPQDWFHLGQRPVVDVRGVDEQKLLLFTGFVDISAVGAAGLLWTTDRLSWEGVTIGEVSGHILRGMGWDALTDKEVAFEVDLSTGKSSGGARPALPGTQK